MSLPIIVLGAGGHARSVVDVIECAAKFHIVGLVVSRPELRKEVMGYQVIGDEFSIPELMSSLDCKHLVVAVGDNYRREAAESRLSSNIPDLQFPALVHPSAIISRRADLSNGCVVMAGAVVNAGVKLEKGCLVNTGAVVDHDCKLGRYSSVAPGCRLGGAVLLGERSSIGIGATVSHSVTVGSDTVVGAGSVVVKDIEPTVVAYGMPCRPRRSRHVDEPYL